MAPADHCSTPRIQGPGSEGLGKGRYLGGRLPLVAQSGEKRDLGLVGYIGRRESRRGGRHIIGRQLVASKQALGQIGKRWHNRRQSEKPCCGKA